MGVISFSRNFLLKRSRAAYNNGKYNRSRSLSYLSFKLFGNRESLDILARSNLRMKRFSRAAKCYRKADDIGLKLLDHYENQFKSELNSLNYIEAYKILNRPNFPKKTKEISVFTRHLKKMTDTERVSLLEDFSEYTKLPREFEDLLPWTTGQIIDKPALEKGYQKVSKNEIVLQRYRREIGRIKDSGSYRIIKHISDSKKDIKKIALLPFSLPRLILRIVSEKTGKKQQSNNLSFQISNSEKNRDCIVFFPTNGVGFGHFTRLLAVAKAFNKLSPDTEIVFFTTMPTLQILSEHGFIGYHLPGRYRYNDMEANVWNPICEELLSLVFSIHRPKAFVFDGAFPYRGMLNAIENQDSDILRVWVRRGGNKKTSSNIPVESISKFNAVIKPGDSGLLNLEEELRNNIPLVKTNPILVQNDGSEEIDIRKRLGIPDFATICYVQLGAGKINDIESEISMTLDAISKYGHIYAIVGESMLGERITSTHDNVRILRDYPNSRFFDQFDFAVIAGGYNSYHEVIEAELPSICYPNFSTGRDDQFARVKIAADEGAMIVLKNRNRNTIGIAISQLSDSKIRNKIRRRIANLKKPNGANEVSLWLYDQLS